MKLLNRLLKKAKVKEINVVNFNDSEILILIIEMDEPILFQESKAIEEIMEKHIPGDVRILYVAKNSNIKFVKYKKPIKKKMTKPPPPLKRRISKSGK